MQPSRSKLTTTLAKMLGLSIVMAAGSLKWAFLTGSPPRQARHSNRWPLLLTKSWPKVGVVYEGPATGISDVVVAGRRGLRCFVVDDRIPRRREPAIGCAITSVRAQREPPVRNDLGAVLGGSVSTERVPTQAAVVRLWRWLV